MDKVIWNDDMTMNFLASKYLASYIYTPPPDDKKLYRVRVQVDGATPGQGRWSGLYYDTCNSQEEAKECLARLMSKLVLAGVIEATEKESTDRFDHVDLREENNENN